MPAQATSAIAAAASTAMQNLPRGEASARPMSRRNDFEPVDPMSVFLGPIARESLLAHCHSANPHEACGVLLGEKSGNRYRVSAVVPAGNIASRPLREYQLDWDTLRLALRMHRRGVRSLLGFYHSHPDGPPVPSRLDIDRAWPELLYCIVALAGRGLRAWPCGSGGRRLFPGLFIRSAGLGPCEPVLGWFLSPGGSFAACVSGRERKATALWDPVPRGQGPGSAQPLEDPGNADARRKDVDLPPLEDYARQMRELYKGEN